MATLYWRAVNGYWTTASNWSTTADGNTPSASVPTSADDVVFTSYSGRCDLGQNLIATCRNLTTDVSYVSYLTLGSATLNLYGNFYVASSSHWPTGDPASHNLLINFYSTNGTIYLNGSSYSARLIRCIVKAGAFYTMTSNLYIESYLYITGQASPILNWKTNGYNLTAAQITCYTTSGAIVEFSNGSVVNIIGSSYRAVAGVLGLISLNLGLRVDADTTAVVNLSSTYSYCALTATSTSTIRNLNIIHTGLPIYMYCLLSSDITNSNYNATITNLSITSTSGSAGSVYFSYSNNTSHSITNLTIKGRSDYTLPVTVRSGTNAFKITSNGGVIDCDYMNLSYSTALGTSVFNGGINSINGGNNTGWIWPQTGFNPLTFGFGCVI